MLGEEVRSKVAQEDPLEGVEGEQLAEMSVETPEIEMLEPGSLVDEGHSWFDGSLELDA